MALRRREFLRSTAGLLATAIAPGAWAVEYRPSPLRRYDFRPWSQGKFAAPVTRVTPGDGFYVFTYFDNCPWSPSQRRLAATRVGFQDRIPVLGETAEACVIDLAEQTIRTVYTTKSWGFQTGANLNWGATDRYLYTNDVIDGQAVCVRIDLEGGEVKAFAGPMYHVAPDESCVLGFPLELLNVTQPGYGPASRDPAHPDSLAPGAPADQGIWRTDLGTNERRLLVRLSDAAACLGEPPPRPGGTFYFWHTKFNQQGTRVMQVLRCLFPDGYGGRNPMVLTYRPDGSDLRLAPFRPLWAAKGGHPNWHPDGQHIVRSMNVGGKFRFCQARWDGTDMTVLSDSIAGGGHPRIEPRGRFVITDRFDQNGSQDVALRLVDLAAQTETAVCTLGTIDTRRIADYSLRLDGHPVWSRDYTKVCLQAAPDGARWLFIVDLKNLV